VARAAFWGAEGLEPEARDMWRELVALAVSSNAMAKKALEVMMAIENFAEKSVWARQAAEKAREAGILTGLEAGRVAGLEAGRVAGLEAGALREARRAVGRVLSRRGLAVSAEQQAKLDTCEDLATLERWHDQAITAPSADEALG
jgi:predicted transposase YdaD